MIKPKFRQTTEPTVVNFDFLDIATGAGYKLFYLGKTANRYVLTTAPFYSELIMEVDGTATTSFSKQQDIDYDVEFREPRTVEGEAWVNIPIGILISVDAKTCETYVIVKIRKYDGTTETDLATAQSTTITQRFTGTNSGYHRAMAAVILDVPSTTFQAGDVLRVTVEQWNKVESGGAAIFMLGQDPKGRAKDEVTPTTTWGTEPSVATALISLRTDQ